MADKGIKTVFPNREEFDTMMTSLGERMRSTFTKSANEAPETAEPDISAPEKAAPLLLKNPIKEPQTTAPKAKAPHAAEEVEEEVNTEKAGSRFSAPIQDILSFMVGGTASSSKANFSDPSIEEAKKTHKKARGHCSIKDKVGIGRQEYFQCTGKGDKLGNGMGRDLSEAQLKEIIIAAIVDKNWKEIYFVRNGKIDNALSQRASLMIADMTRTCGKGHELCKGHEINVRSTLPEVAPWAKSRKEKALHQHCRAQEHAQMNATAPALPPRAQPEDGAKAQVPKAPDSASKKGDDPLASDFGPAVEGRDPPEKAAPFTPKDNNERPPPTIVAGMH
jgi:hypothetical protein